MSDNKSKCTVSLDLQLFAEGAGGTGNDASGVGASGDAPAVDAGQPSGVRNRGISAAAEGAEVARDAAGQQDQTPAGDDPAREETNHHDGAQEEPKAGGDDRARQAAYAKLKAEYRDLFDAEVQGIVRGRIREANTRIKDTMPILDRLAVRYGTEPGDFKALKAAMDADRLYLSAKAEETGTTEEIQAELERYRTRETTERRQAREEASAKRYAELTAQAKAVKAAYPAFDVRAEMKDPQFVKLMDAGLDMRTAYEVTHKNELQKATVQYTARQAAVRSAQAAEDNLVAGIKANGLRPTENAARGHSPASARIDPSKLSSEQIGDLLRRAQAGERIAF